MFGRGFNSLRLHPLNYFVSWCNGSTTDSGPVCQGSNPCRTTIYHTCTVAGVSRRAKISERAHSSAGLEHLSYKQRVIGSNPIGPTKSFRLINLLDKTRRASPVRVKLFLFFRLSIYMVASCAAVALSDSSLVALLRGESQE